ncbi:hypothetical protein [Amycolatopsis sp. PS_44_ISF1]|uniref:hypothetical protein n=1 Tax=Amycolatopsis sp. PS_44_ISF1 TaxID=2974917 RepID=UPI0028E01B77|nr:hypothetical protein [Amycolatopsis sp. PS_44_ISF1]MDT8913261.1 hypothetical protein [Amycolatopsis sp. PS_44_ISF1]
MTAPQESALERARAVAADSARAHQEAFAERLVSVHLLGSLSYGGYAPAVSDIDLAVVLADRHDDDPGVFATVAEALHGRDPLYRKLSVFWGSRPALARGEEDGRFPAIDRLELADHSSVLLGEDVSGEVARPSERELMLEGARFALDRLAVAEVTAEFHRPRRLLSDPVRFTKAVLFPVRFLCSAAKSAGRAAANDEAIDWYLTGPAPAAPLVRLAARVRAGDPLVPAEAAPELAAHLRPLYRQYLEDQTVRLRRADAPAELVTAFDEWDGRLA